MVLAIEVVGSCCCAVIGSCSHGCWFLLLQLLVLALVAVGSCPCGHWFLPLQSLVLAIAVVDS